MEGSTEEHISESDESQFALIPNEPNPARGRREFMGRLNQFLYQALVRIPRDAMRRRFMEEEALPRLDLSQPSAYTQMHGPQAVAQICSLHGDVQGIDVTGNPDAIGGVIPYQARVLANLRDGDGQIIDQNVREHIGPIFEYLKFVGLDASSDGHLHGIERRMNGDNIESLSQAFLRICREDPKYRDYLLKRYPGKLIPYNNSPTISNGLGSEQGFNIDGCGYAALNVNNKALLQELYLAGFSVPLTLIGESTDDIMNKYERYFVNGEQKIKSVVLKPNFGASGLGVMLCDSKQELEEALQNDILKNAIQSKDNGYIIQEKIDIIDSPGVVLRIGNSKGKYLLLGSSEQMLEKASPSDPIPTVHSGNFGESKYMDLPGLQGELRVLCDYLYDMGFRGDFGVDLAIYRKENGDLDYTIVEINGRQTGQEHGILAVHQLRAKSRNDLAQIHWAVNNTIPVPPGTGLEGFIGYLARFNILYNGGPIEVGSTVVLPMNLATGAHGKAQVLALTMHENPAYARRILRELLLACAMI